MYFFEIYFFSNILVGICGIAKTNNFMVLNMNINVLTLQKFLVVVYFNYPYYIHEKSESRRG